jgi:hypothetical protein
VADFALYAGGTKARKAGLLGASIQTRADPMKLAGTCIALMISLFALAVPVQAKGCLKGAAVGGAVGHYAGHHGVAGALIGCAVGHHEARKHQQESAH